MPTNLRLYDGYDNRPELKDEVYQLQQKLANQGYPLEPDGEFGPGTEKVVKQFQKDHLLNADGIVGVDTWDALNQQAEDTTKPVSQGASATLTTDMLKAIMPSGKTSQLELFCPALNRQLVTYQLQSPLRQAHFLPQVAHESGSFNYTSENLNYSASALRQVFGKYFTDDAIANQYARKPEKIASRVYASRMGNGDEASGEGWKFRGRGLIQLTGKDNYTSFGQSLAIDLLTDPDSVSTNPDHAVQAACWYWDVNKLNQDADRDDIKTITRKINGGYNGLDDRTAFLNRAKQVLGV
ncbi:MAG TPA: glycoside hydrolase [Cryomorphaceae bacterium]|nr:glycoside hydrolase [Cryomorphaceae bacterium]